MLEEAPTWRGSVTGSFWNIEVYTMIYPRLFDAIVEPFRPFPSNPPAYCILFSLKHRILGTIRNVVLWIEVLLWGQRMRVLAAGQDRKKGLGRDRVVLWAAVVSQVPAWHFQTRLLLLFFFNFIQIKKTWIQFLTSWMLGASQTTNQIAQRAHQAPKGSNKWNLSAPKAFQLGSKLNTMMSNSRQVQRQKHMTCLPVTSNICENRALVQTRAPFSQSM